MTNLYVRGKKQCARDGVGQVRVSPPGHCELVVCVHGMQTVIVSSTNHSRSMVLKVKSLRKQINRSAYLGTSEKHMCSQIHGTVTSEISSSLPGIPGSLTFVEEPTSHNYSHTVFPASPGGLDVTMLSSSSESPQGTNPDRACDILPAPEAEKHYLED